MTGLDFVLLYLAGSLTFIFLVKLIERKHVSPEMRTEFVVVSVLSTLSWIAVIFLLPMFLPTEDGRLSHIQWQDW